jgi:hypothetical protein
MPLRLRPWCLRYDCFKQICGSNGLWTRGDRGAGSQDKKISAKNIKTGNMCLSVSIVGLTDTRVFDTQANIKIKRNK